MIKNINNNNNPQKKRHQHQTRLAGCFTQDLSRRISRHRRTTTRKEPIQDNNTNQALHSLCFLSTRHADTLTSSPQYYWHLSVIECVNPSLWQYNGCVAMAGEAGVTEERENNRITKSYGRRMDDWGLCEEKMTVLECDKDGEWKSEAGVKEEREQTFFTRSYEWQRRSEVCVRLVWRKREIISYWNLKKKGEWAWCEDGVKKERGYFFHKELRMTMEEWGLCVARVKKERKKLKLLGFKEEGRMRLVCRRCEGETTRYQNN